MWNRPTLFQPGKDAFLTNSITVSDWIRWQSLTMQNGSAKSAVVSPPAPDRAKADH